MEGEPNADREPDIERSPFIGKLAAPWFDRTYL